MRLTTLEKILHLRRVPLFSEMGGRELRQVADVAAEEPFEPSHVIFCEGDPGAKLYIVVEGTVEIFLGENTVLTSVSTGGFFGEMSIFDQEPRSASVRTTVKTVCLTLSSEDFRELVFAFPTVVFPILQHISRNLRRANKAQAE